MHSAWCEAGGDPERFWHITPKEAAREMAALRKRHVMQHDALMATAWHAAVIPLMKKIPQLKDLLIGEDGARMRGRKQPREELIANLKAALGFTGKEH